MIAAVPLLDAPAAGFDQPFEMLLACHQRVDRMLRLLQRLAPHLATHGADAEAVRAAQAVLRYFDLAGPAHHEDEERHLLPLLRARGDASLRALAARLRREHRTMTSRWRGVRADLQAVCEGRWRRRPAAAARWAAFATLYRRHIDDEERIAYAGLRPWLDARALASMGREMAARRGAPVAS